MSRGGVAPHVLGCSFRLFFPPIKHCTKWSWFYRRNSSKSLPLTSALNTLGAKGRWRNWNPERGSARLNLLRSIGGLDVAQRGADPLRAYTSLQAASCP